MILKGKLNPYFVYAQVFGLNLNFRNLEKLSEGGNYVLGPHTVADSCATG